MLILTRRVGEKVRIGEGIKVTILGIRNNQVRIGFEAPDDVKVNREEVYLRSLHSDASNSPDESTQDSTVIAFKSPDLPPDDGNDAA